MADNTLEEKLNALKRKQDRVDDFAADDVRTLVEGIEYAMSHGGTVGVTVTALEDGYKITITESEGVAHEATLKNGGDAYEVYKSTVPSGQTPLSKDAWLASLKGADGQDGQDGAPGADAVNPFKGYYPTGVSKPVTGATGDYLYAAPNDSQSTATATIWYYDANQTPPWTDTGIDVSTVVGVEFGSGQSVPATKIKDENGEEVSGLADVLSAEAGKKINDTLGDLPLYVEQVVDLQITESLFTNNGFWRPDGTHNTTNTGYRTTDPIDVSAYDKLILSCHSNNVISPCVFLDENEDFVFAIPAAPSGLTNENITIPKNLGAKYAVFSCAHSSSIYSEFSVYGIVKVPIANFIGKESCYLSVTGNDENDGLTIETPVKTLVRAKQITTNTLYIMEGEYEMVLSELDLGIFDNIIGIGNVVINAKPFIKVTEGELVQGYTKVYSYMHGNKTISDNMDFIWQHNIPDPATFISDSEKHPLQKGKLYRLPSTRLYRASSIQDIENSTDKLMFFNDSTNKTLYFSKIDNSDLSVNPIVIHLNSSAWEVKTSVKKHVHIENIDVRYGCIITERLSGEFVNCSAGMCYHSGAWILDNSSIKLYQCEGYAAYVPTGGDGFNTHTAGQIEMFDCWGHDNHDDGESAHENVTIIQHGGLYEYNGNGCTPASGAKASYYNVICRNNANHDWVYSENPRVGFSNQSSDGSGGIICFNCVAENSEIGFRNTNANSPSCCYNCIVINCTIAYSNIRTISSQVQSDWTETDNTKPSFIKNKPS